MIGSILSTPLLWLTVTLGVFEAADTLSKRFDRHPLLHPVLWATPVLIALLLASGTSYDTYKTATLPLSFLLGPAVVGLAVPIWRERARIRRLALPITLSLVAGAVVSIVTAVGVLALFGAPRELLASIAPRATTTPVAMAVAQILGGMPALAAAIVLFAGVIGAMVATPLLDALGVRDYRARGFGVGVAAHGFGAVRAFQVNETAGALASLGMALNAVFTATLLSVLALLA